MTLKQLLVNIRNIRDADIRYNIDQDIIIEVCNKDYYNNITVIQDTDYNGVPYLRFIIGE